MPQAKFLRRRILLNSPGYDFGPNQPPLLNERANQLIPKERKRLRLRMRMNSPVRSVMAESQASGWIAKCF